MTCEGVSQPCMLQREDCNMLHARALTRGRSSMDTFLKEETQKKRPKPDPYMQTGSWGKSGRFQHRASPTVADTRPCSFTWIPQQHGSIVCGYDRVLCQLTMEAVELFLPFLEYSQPGAPGVCHLPRIDRKQQLRDGTREASTRKAEASWSQGK